MTVVRRLAIAAAALGGACFALGPGGAASPSANAQSVTPTCNGGSCGPWFRTDVTLAWDWSPRAGVTRTDNCGVVTYTSDTRQATSCTVTWGSPPDDSSLRKGVEVKLDKTAPTVTMARPDRTPDVHGWYNHPVRFDFGGSDAMSGIADCASVEYSAPEGRAVSVSGSCRDVAGNAAQASVPLSYDATAPAIRAQPERPPDANGWYTKPVAFAFDGADSVSGVETCTSGRYEGPDSGSATVAGSCTDRAGNTATQAAPVPYDATPPSLELTRVVAGRTSATIEWSASPDATRAIVTRSPSARGRTAAEIFSGAGTAYTDTGARRRREYRYKVRVADPAGHHKAKTVAVVPGVGPVLRPGEDAGVTQPPLLRWRANRRADYYNVQLHRVAASRRGRVTTAGGGRKIASSWPGTARLKLHRSWRFRGRKERLTPGSYRWYVWPGFGRRSERRYGALVGTGDFRVVG